MSVSAYERELEDFHYGMHEIAQAQQAKADARSCTCHPDEKPVDLPTTLKATALFILDQMRASGSWDKPTLTRAIEIIQGLSE